MGLNLLRLCVSLGLFASFSVAQTRGVLQAAADGVVLGDFTDDETADTVYQTVSTNYGNLTTYAGVEGWTVTAVNATIELSTNATYAYSYLAGNGTSRFNVTVHLSQSSGANTNSPPVTASISTVTCSGNVAANLLRSNLSTVAMPALTIVPASNTVTSQGNQTGSAIYQELIEYENAQSVGIYANGNLVACQNLQPPFPDFPNDWSATIENTDRVNGTTFVFVEQYSQSMNKIRLDLHSFGANRIILTDTASSSVTAIIPSNGTCRSRSTRRTNWITGQDNVTLVSTAELLHFSANQFSYVPGQYSVRGIQCELWTANVNFSNNWANASFTANYYFPIDQWLVNREDYHRLLKQVELMGTFNGQPMDQISSYVDFRPRTYTAPTFEVCAISPYGSGCNCTNALRRAAFSNVPALAPAQSDGDDFEVNGELGALCDYAHPVPHGFISAQSGPYVGLTIIGMIGGSLITGIAMFLFYRRRRSGVSITDNLNNNQKFTEFRDAPGA